ncbi:MAG: UDP-N-acetylglucosamine 1-carboxyvinyltransferase [Lachnospiraceae bacterium]|nr:UDP-N-acetylglucosamine 1-carboxyvinyltransferase [Lachnospiraceae bacterium]
MQNDNRHIFVRGGKRLSGEVYIEGSKNSTLVCMAAAALADKDTTVTLNNVPDISDVGVMADLLRALGKTVNYEDETMTISGELKYTELPRELCGSIRGSTYFLGVMMAGLNHAYLGLPGGDRIGDRPIDIHLDNLEMMGMKYKLDGGVVEATAPNGLKGMDLFLRFPSVGATCNIILAASRAKGKTTISNCAKEPEIVDLANLLTKMGVKITGAGSDKITVYGSAPVKADVVHDVISDRIETGVFLTAVAITGGDAVIKNCIPTHNNPLIQTLTRAGIFIEYNDNEIHIVSTGVINPLKVTTMPYPGVATDLQPLLTVLAVKADGESSITDLVFPERFSYIYELSKMGAKVEHNGNTVKIKGVKKLDGSKLVGSDIRAATALICAGLIADGTTEVEGMHHIERGYKNFVEKLKGLGAEIMVK